MKTAIVGSRNLSVDLSQYIPADTTEIISGGAKGVDSLAEAYAKEHHIPIRIFYPQYSIYGKAAPLVRNREIVQACDRLIAIWDGTSRGTQYTVQYARTAGKEVVIHQID